MCFRPETGAAGRADVPRSQVTKSRESSLLAGGRGLRMPLSHGGDPPAAQIAGGMDLERSDCAFGGPDLARAQAYSA
jgi:hypothetical protein